MSAMWQGPLNNLYVPTGSTRCTATGRPFHRPSTPGAPQASRRTGGIGVTGFHSGSWTVTVYVLRMLGTSGWKLQVFRRISFKTPVSADAETVHAIERPPAVQGQPVCQCVLSARWPPVGAWDRQRWAVCQGGACFIKDGNGKLCLAAPPPVLFRLTQIHVEVL